MCTETDLEMAVTAENSATTSSTKEAHLEAAAGYFMRWSRIEKSVEVREASTGLIRSSIAGKLPDDRQVKGPQKKVILNGISGYAAPGELLALMGPSGSGKTSLLNALSGRSSYDSGTLTINGDAITGQGMKRLMSKIAYVKQADVFFGHLTVRDQLTYTALLRLPSEWTRARKLSEVDRIIAMLRLGKVSESPIMLLSGGEKKRVNISSELLTDPSVVLLDEPTSGLDSTSAVALLKMLQKLAQTHGKTVVTSIHQPSSAVFRSFDRLLMLAEGSVVYFGTPVGGLGYLRDHGFACPDGYNAADHWMDLLVVDSAVEEEEESDIGTTERDDSMSESWDEETDDNHNSGTLRRRSSAGRIRKQRTGCAPDASSRQQLIEAWDGEAVAEQMDMANKDTDAKSATHGASEGPGALAETKKYNSNWATQFAVLTHRSLKNSRSAIFTPLNLTKSALIGLVAGLLWFQLPYTESTVSDRSSYYFFTMTYWVFDSMFNALMSFPSEREVILKERASGSYHLSAYFLAKTTSEAPTRLALPLIYMSISFWMGGLNPKFGVFVSSTCCTLLSVLAGESIGLSIGASIYEMDKALTVMTVFSLALMLLGGFFVQNVPEFLTWAKYLSPFKYAFDASQQLVFDRPVPCDGSGALEELCAGQDTGYASPEEIYDFLGITGSVGFNVGLLCVLIVIPRFVAYVALRSKKAAER